MSTLTRFLLPCCLAVLMTAPDVLADDLLTSEGQEIRRGVLALYDSAGTSWRLDSENPIRQVLEMPLNHLGMVVRRYDIRHGPPPPESLEGARAIVTYFVENQAPCPDWLWPWMETAIRKRGLRVVHFGGFGPLGLTKPGERPERLIRWLRGFGLDYDHGYAAGTFEVSVSFPDLAACSFEASPQSLRVHRGPRNLVSQNRPWVVTRSRRENEPRSPVITGPWGALALAPYWIHPGDIPAGRRWTLDLFRFLREALGLDGVPAPHPAVLNGRRMFMLHVDGDGFESLSTVQPGELCGKVFLDEIIERYELPLTVSVIVGSLTDDLEVAEPTAAMRMARRVLSHERVEPASHSVLHPLDWSKPLTARSPPRTVTSYPGLQNYEYDQAAEVRESIRFINERLLKPGKRCRLMLWSGEANPSRRVLDECERLGILNLNAGVFRWDEAHDSISFVSPWARLLGNRIQVHAGAANENDFKGFFTTMPGAFAHIDTTLQRTKRHGILKPANLYIHFYSVERPGRLAALHRLIRRWAIEEPTAPVFASTYIEAVRSAIQGARILRRPHGWAFRDFGACRSVRIDGEKRHVDWVRSSGLLGARRMNGTLYLHLAAPDAELVFAQEPQPGPHVEQANHLLTDAALGETGVAVTSESLAHRVLVFAGFRAGSGVLVRIDGAEEARTADERGRVSMALKPGGPTRIEAVTR
ncbi:MAG: hypothetical protein ACE10D_01445 [Planctomycetota bacterium]|nr:hypothetical protein [Planctomycetota bacterium]